LRVANVLLPSTVVRLMVTGGIVRPGEQSFIGASTNRMFSEYHFDLFVMTASGIHLQNGLTEWNLEDAEVKRAALKASARCIVAGDLSKFGRTAFVRVADCSEVDVIVTDAPLPDAQVEMFMSMGVSVQAS
jgi:DeoR/GlpR family transcriptional regulator of sugar metabolism